MTFSLLLLALMAVLGGAIAFGLWMATSALGWHGEGVAMACGMAGVFVAGAIVGRAVGNGG